MDEEHKITITHADGSSWEGTVSHVYTQERYDHTMAQIKRFHEEQDAEWQAMPWYGKLLRRLRDWQAERRIRRILK